MKFTCNVGVLLALLVGSSSSTDAFQYPSAGCWGKRSSSSSAFSLSSRLNGSKLFAGESNIVLRPSDVEAEFDSLKIGGCTVHRYDRGDGESDLEAEYVMWYHGRSVEQDKDKTLPPLSTGRIGRATSRNGLSWKKDEVGSESEDIEGVAVGLNTESWWCFDTAHVGLGSVLLPMSTPAVITEGGVYLMYYMGGSYDETPIGDYVDKEMPADATIKGMKMKIGVCVSQDGKTWGRVEGDDPTGACVVPYDAADPNCKGLEKIDGLEEELYCAWPEVTVKPDSEGFFMYYSVMTKGNKEKSIAFAESPDGFRWEKRPICIKPDDGTMDAGGCARCTVVRNAAYDEMTGTWSDSPGYMMLYEGVSKEDNKHRIMMAESRDGKAWTKKGVVFDVGGDDAWDAEGVGSPHIIR